MLIDKIKEIFYNKKINITLADNFFESIKLKFTSNSVIGFKDSIKVFELTNKTFIELVNDVNVIINKD